MNKLVMSTLAITLVTSGCVFNDMGEGAATDGQPAFDTTLNSNSELIASNLVYAMAQLEELRPIQTTVQITEPKTPLGKTVLDRLKDAGYGIQIVETDIGPSYVRYKFEDSTTERGPISRYTMSIGGIEVSRDFTIRGDNMYPDSAIEIVGAKDAFIELNDKIFEERGDNYEENVVFIDAIEPVFDGQTQLASANDSASTPVEPIKKNMYVTRSSNYSSLFSEYDDLESKVLIFPNDSMVMGAKNKKVVNRFAQQMNPETDLISVIGCSHGKSNIQNGNSVLAVGRANRVKEAFVFAGVEYGKVMDEGCWAPRHFDEMMPRRGVVLTLKRRKG